MAFAFSLATEKSSFDISGLPRQGSNLDSSDPESDVLPITPQGSIGYQVKVQNENSKERDVISNFSFLLLNCFPVDPIGIEPTTSRVRF